MSTDLVIASQLADLAPAIKTTLERLKSANSRRAYTMDIKLFLQWMLAHHLVPALLGNADLVSYQAYLLERYAKSGAARRISTIRTLLSVQAHLTGAPNPAEGLPKISLDDESPHRALSKQEARELLLAIDRETLIGKRNYAIIKL